MSLRRRIAATLAVVALAVGAGAASASYLDTSRQLRHSTDEALTSRINALVTSYNQGGHGGDHGHGPDGGPDGGPNSGADKGSGNDQSNGCPAAGSFAPATAAQLVSSAGAITACVSGAPALPTFIGGSAGPTLATVTISGERYRAVSEAWPAGGRLELAISVDDVDDVLEGLRLRLVLFVAVAAVLAALLGAVIASWVVRPIVRLRDAAARIAATLDLETPVDVRASGEVGSLAGSFVSMVDAVRKSQAQQRNLVADAGHEMRTPLTSLRSNVELIRRIQELPAVERDEVVDDVLADVDELSDMLAELVDLSSDLAAAEPDEQVRLADIARAAAQRTERRTGRAVEVVELADEEIRARPRQLERAISNLVDNAAKYSPPQDPIEVEVSVARVVVRDRGPGVTPEDLPRIFDRFYRSLEARTQPGSGLGLAIVEEIVRSHGGEVFARNRVGGGLEIGFDLAAADHRSRQVRGVEG